MHWLPCNCPTGAEFAVRAEMGGRRQRQLDSACSLQIGLAAPFLALVSPCKPPYCSTSASPCCTVPKGLRACAPLHGARGSFAGYPRPRQSQEQRAARCKPQEARPRWRRRPNRSSSRRGCRVSSGEVGCCDRAACKLAPQPAAGAAASHRPACRPLAPCVQRRPPTAATSPPRCWFCCLERCWGLRTMMPCLLRSRWAPGQLGLIWRMGRPACRRNRCCRHARCAIDPAAPSYHTGPEGGRGAAVAGCAAD